MFKTSVLFEANYQAGEDIIVNQGGSYSAKTYSILQVLNTIACKEKCVITVVGESIPNLKAGALRDQCDIVNDSEVLKSCISDYNRTERLFLYDTGAVMEFKSYLTPQDAKSGKRDYLFVNEGQGISYEIFHELWMRTRIRTWIDFNPNAEFWVHEKLIGQKGVKLIISDHRHNPFTPQKIRDKLEGLKLKDMELFKVYARGRTGKIEGLVLRNWHIVEEIPKDAEFISYGLDWGFTNDPTSFIEVYRYNGELYVNELVYQTGLTNSDLIRMLNNLGVNKKNYTVADSAEPKSIEDLKRGGFSIYGAQKGKDSINASINILKDFKINITRSSVNLLKELRSYIWQKDNEGKSTNTPVDFNNHAIDALRYVALNKLGRKGEYTYRVRVT